jgi:hypothetical protein
MAQSLPSVVDSEVRFPETSEKNEAQSAGISWAAVVAGAFVAAALSLVLLALGAGIGLSSISPWSNTGAAASAVGKAAIIWTIITQVIASATGGYLAGRLRTKWVNIHTDEVYFRDTAHGFLVWAIGLVVTAAFLTSAAAAMVSGSNPVQTSSDTPPIRAARSFDRNDYFVDVLFRSDHPKTDAAADSMRAEAGLILVNAVRQREFPTRDKAYLAELVAARTGLSQSDAEQRVDEVFEQDRTAVDTARKATAHSLYWLFLALLVGAFCASCAATLGGRQRDHLQIL